MRRFDENCCNHEDFLFQEAEDGVAGCEEERGETGQWKIQSAKLCQVPGASESAHHFLEPVQAVQPQCLSKVQNSHPRRVLAVQRVRQGVVRDFFPPLLSVNIYCLEQNNALHFVPKYFFFYQGCEEDDR